jgi:hypothetical protein
MTADRLSQACADGQVLQYSAASAVWICAVPAGLQGPAGPQGPVGPQGPAGTTNASGITSGTLGVAYGGTGLTSVASGSYLAGNGTGALLAKTPAQVKTALALVKGDVGLGSVENTALSTWAGSTNITTLGTITTGTVPVARVSGLGSAALYNAGAAGNNVVQLDGSARLPAVDGSQLTNIRNSDGLNSTFFGTSALAANTAQFNSAFGFEALKVNTTGTPNEAFGERALYMNTTGSKNSAFGYTALSANTIGSDNIGIGYGALGGNTTANKNVAIGESALANQNFTNGGSAFDSSNVAIGFNSMLHNNPTSTTKGVNNTAVGALSLQNNGTGSNNIAVGYNAGSQVWSLDYNIEIGNVGTATDMATIRIGDNNQTRAFIAGIRGVTPANGPVQAVVIGTDGQLGSAGSGSGTVTSVAVSGGTTGLTTSGGPVTGSGTITLAGTLAVGNGGTGATTLTGYVKGTGTTAMTASATVPAGDITGLGTAATLNVGTGNNNVVQLNGSAKLPAVDGSQLTKTRESDSSSNVLFGSSALAANTTGTSNSAFGDWALHSNTTGSGNVGVGMQALVANTIGNENTGIGYVALQGNTTANNNVAIGPWALVSQNYSNGGAAYDSNNVAIGVNSLRSNNPTSTTTGVNNTAVGSYSLQDNTIGVSNSALGAYSLYNNTLGHDNVAIGYDALTANTTAYLNTAVGSGALATQAFNNGGLAYSAANTAVGANSLANNNPTNTSTGFNNTAVGANSLSGNTTGANNTALGYAAGSNVTTGSFNIDIGNAGVAGDATTIRIGDTNQTKTFIAGISGVTSAGGAAVYVNASGQLGTATSSRRFKEDIQDMGTQSDRIFNLRPVTFKYKSEYGGGGIQYGLIAEEVNEVIPEMTVWGKDGQIQTVAYQMLPPMLLNELQKEHRTNQEQEAAIQRLTAENADLKARLSKIEQALGL